MTVCVFSMGIYIPVFSRLIYGPALFTKGSILQQRFEDFQKTVLMNLIVTGVFPFCRGLYDLLHPGYRGAVIIVLPIWEFGVKLFAVCMCRQVEDFMPELVAFSVDFFGSLFSSVCMSTSGSFLPDRSIRRDRSGALTREVSRDFSTGEEYQNASRPQPH